MKSILIFTLNLNAGGAENQLIKIAKLLVKNGRAVTFLVYKEEGSHLEDLNNTGIRIISIKKRNYVSDAYHLARLVKKERFDYVLSFLPPCNLVNELSRFFHSKHSIVVGARSSRPEFKESIKYKYFYWAHSLADCVISNSEMNKKDILIVNRHLQSEKIKVIYNLTDNITPQSSYIPFVSDKINIVVAANLRKVKNVDGLITALTMLSPKDRSKIRIDWFGFDCGVKEEALHAIAESSIEDSIGLHDSSQTVTDEMNKADVVALFSHYEGLPNSLCEAFSLEKMVICTPVSDMPQLLSDTGNVVCDSDSPEDIKNGLLRLINEPRESIIKTGQRNKEQFSALFAREIIEKQLLSIF